MSDLDILYFDDYIILVNKPSGLLSVTGRGEANQDSVITRAMRYFPDALTVHRLDQATSGLILLARGKLMQSALSKAFVDKKVYKQYKAVVRGHLSGYGDIRLPIFQLYSERPRSRVFDNDIVASGIASELELKRVRQCYTQYRALDYCGINDVTNVLLIPKTGRSHQLRVHLSAIGFPIVNDVFYGGDLAGDFLFDNKMMLCASHLQFKHPFYNKPMAFDCGFVF